MICRYKKRGYRFYKVTVLLGHNRKRGRKAAPDVVRVVVAQDCIHAGNIARSVLTGVKEIVEIRPVSIKELLVSAQRRWVN